MKWATPLLLSSRRHAKQADCPYGRKHNSIWVRRSFPRSHPDLNFSPLLLRNLFTIPRFLILIHFNKLDGCRFWAVFPFEDERNQFAAFTLSNYHWKVPFQLESGENSMQTTISKFLRVLKWSISNSKATSWFFRCDFLRNKLPPKTQNAGGESTRASAAKVLQLLFQIWVEMEINSGPFAQSSLAACRTLHPNCVISSERDVQQLLEKIKNSR